MAINIYSLKLHEAVDVNGLQILRVPGGWIYSRLEWNQPANPNQPGEWILRYPVFVPWNSEYQR